MNQYVNQTTMDYVISTGDHFFPDGVDSMFDSLWNLRFENFYLLYPFNSLDWFVTLGDIDWRKSPYAQIEYQSKSQRWNLPYFRYTKEFIFNTEEKAQFIFISTTPFSEIDRQNYPEVGKTKIQDEINWLKKELEKGKGEFNWRYVIGHHPIYSGGPNGNFGHENMTDIENLLNEYQIDGYISGHDYILQHLQVNSTNYNYTMDYYISGAAGQSILSNLTLSPFNIFGYGNSEGFMTMNLSRNQTIVNFFDSQGRIIYKYEKIKNI